MAYVRLHLPPALAEQIAATASALQATSHGCFFSQLDPRAGLACHPLHLTLLGGMDGFQDHEVQAMLETSASSLAPPAISFSGWEMGSHRLKLAVQSTELGPLANVLKRRLSGGIVWRPPYHITIGTFVGPFEDRGLFLEKVRQDFPAMPKDEYRCCEVAYENNSPDRDNPAPVPLKSDAAVPPTSASPGASTDVCRLVGQARALCNALPQGIAMKCQQKSGFDGGLFTSLDTVDHGGIVRAALQPIHDAIRTAFNIDPSATLQLLDQDNAYCNCLADVETSGLSWESKLKKLHASVLYDGGDATVKAAVDRLVASDEIVGVDCVAVRQQEQYKGSSNHRGHLDTPSALLCYRSGRNVWVTLHLAPQQLLQRNLQPGDGFYFHLSLAKLSKSKGLGKGFVATGNSKGTGSVSTGNSKGAGKSKGKSFVYNIVATSTGTGKSKGKSFDSKGKGKSKGKFY